MPLLSETEINAFMGVQGWQVLRLRAALQGVNQSRLCSVSFLRKVLRFRPNHWAARD